MKGTKKSKHGVNLYPDADQIKEARQNLPSFQPHDLESLVEAAKASGDPDLDQAVSNELRRCNNEQMNALLRHFGIDPSQPDAWQRLAFTLATIHCGVGAIEYKPRDTRKNAASWTPSDDLRLLESIGLRKRKGLSERKAIKQLACDPAMRGKFPYRAHWMKSLDRVGENKRREAALRDRCRRLKKSSTTETLMRQLLGAPPSMSSIEHTMWQLDLRRLNLQVPTGVNQNAPSEHRS
jgi:hypothetical protein